MIQIFLHQLPASIHIRQCSILIPQMDTLISNTLFLFKFSDCRQLKKSSPGSIAMLNLRLCDHIFKKQITNIKKDVQCLCYLNQNKEYNKIIIYVF